MPIPVEINFPADFASDKPSDIPIGRLILGKYIGRLYFCQDGTLRLSIDEGAIGTSIILYKIDPEELYGFGGRTTP